MNKKGKIYTICITGVGGGVGQSVIRALKLSGLSYSVVATDIEPWSAGLYVASSGHIVPSSFAPNYLDRLLEIVELENVQVLIPGTDDELPLLAQYTSSLLEKGCFVLVGASEVVRLCRDKLATSIFFIEKGFPFVHTVPISEVSKLVKEVGFPLIIKPRGGSASRGVRVVFSEEELEKYLTSNEDLIAQEYLVPKSWGISRTKLRLSDVMRGYILRQEDEISIQILFDHKGYLLGCFTSRNVLRDGVPIRIDPWPDSTLESIAEKMAYLLVDIGLIGPCNLQCKLTETGPIFFEINPRFTGITALRAAMGFNEVEAVLRRILLDESVDQVRRRLRVPSDLVSIRYITELIVPRNKIETAKRQGHVCGLGWSTTL